MKTKKAFTLMELLIVIAIIALIAVVALVLFNPMKQIGKSYDARRKHDLAEFQKAMEDYYNDKGCYPALTDICYDDDEPDQPVNICGPGIGGNRPLESQTCHICGDESDSPPFSPYLAKFPCDPEHKQKQYLYEVPAVSGLLCSAPPISGIEPCPQYYRVYSNLSNQSDLAIEEVGCILEGCGIAPNYGYDYGVTSPNEKLKKTSSYYCYTKSSTCDNCGTYEHCITVQTCLDIYSSGPNCCLHQPKPIGCS